MLKKSYQGFTAQKISKITDMARSKKIENVSSKNEGQEHHSPSQNASLAIPPERSNSVHLQDKSLFDSYRVKKSIKEEVGAVKEPHGASDSITGNLEDHIWASRKAYQNQKSAKGLNLPPKDYFSRKRKSRDEVKLRGLMLPIQIH